MTYWRDRIDMFAQNNLRKVKNWDDLQTFFKTHKHIELRSKRSGRRVFGFGEYINPQKVHYLIDDGVSTGLCYFKNLYRVVYAEKV